MELRGLFSSMDLVIFAVFVALWLFFQLFLGPRLGIPTCLSGSCSVSPKPSQEPEESETKGA